VVAGVIVRGKPNCGWRLQEQQVGYLVPAVLVLRQQVSKLVGVAHQEGPDLLHHSDQAGAPGSAVEPDCERGGTGVRHVGLYEDVVDLAGGYGGGEVAGVDD